MTVFFRLSQWTMESGELDLFFFVGPTPEDLLRQYTHVTGRPVLPPLWSLGYHQSRWNYVDQQDVAQVDAGFDASG